MTTAEERLRFRRRVAQRAGLELSSGATWALVRISEHGPERARSLASADGVPPERIAAVTQELRGLGLLVGGGGQTGEDGHVPDGSRDGAGGNGQAELTATGREHAERLLSARCELLTEALADDGAERDPQVLSLLRRLSVELCGDPPSVEQPAAA